jgi:hypothetical protein
MPRRLLARTGLSIALALAAMSGAAAQAAPPGGTTDTGGIIIDTPWTRATPGGAKVGAGYMTIINHGDSADRLVNGTSQIAERVEIHNITMDGGVMRMRKLEDGLGLAPKSVTELKPGGYHIMFIGLKKPITKGDQIALSLTFEKAGTIAVTLPAAGIGASQPPGGAGGAGAAAGSRSGAIGSHSVAAGSSSGTPAAGSHSGHGK